MIAVDDLPERGEDQDKRGPAERIAFDEEGKPTKAAEGFARGAGVTVEELERRDGHVWAHVAGESVVDTLPERLPQIVRGLAFTKSMKWEADGLRFARPIRWLVAKVGKDTVEASLDGLTAGADVVRTPLDPSRRRLDQGRGQVRGRAAQGRRRAGRRRPPRRRS